MTNPKHTDTSRSDDLVERLRGDLPDKKVESHWITDYTAVEMQNREAADRIEALEAENERLREALEKIAGLSRWETMTQGGNAATDAVSTARAALETKHD